MLIAKVIKAGDSLGITLPKEVVDRLKIGEGDTVYLSETAHGYEISPYDEGFARQVDAADGIIRRYRNAFRKLAE